MINFVESEQLEREIQEQTDLLKSNTAGLESDIEQFKEVVETLNLLVAENADLEQRLSISETKYAELQQQVTTMEEMLHKRDEAMKFLLKTVGDLNNRVTQIRNSLGNQGN